MNRQAKFAAVALLLFGVSVAAVAPQIAPGQSAAVEPAQLPTNGPTRSTPSTPRSAADEEFDAFVQTQFPPQPPIGTRPATAAAAAPQAPPPEGVFFAAVSQLRDVITPAMRKELAGTDPLARDLAVSALASSIDRLYEAGKKLQEHERTNRLGTSNSPFIIKDADYGEMKGAFDGYRQASTASEKSEAALKLVELVREISEVYEKNWPYNIGVINASQMMGGWVTNGPPANPPTLAPLGSRPVTRQVTEERMLPNGQRQRLTREVVEYVAEDATSAIAAPGIRTAPPATSAADRLDTRLRSAIETFRNAEGQAKTDARQLLQAALRSYFQRDISRREGEVGKLEDQVRNLRTQLDRRRENRDELIDLQMKLIENEAEGLAFFTGPPTNPPAMYDWYGRAVPPGGPQAMNPPGTRDWYGRPLDEPSATASRNPNSNVLDIKLDENGRVPAFDLSGRTWPDVLAWYAKLANRSLDWQELPSGNVNVGIAGPSSLENVRDLLSQRLLDRGFVLSESDGVVQVRKSEVRNPRPPAETNRDRRLPPPGRGPNPSSENRKTPPQNRQPIGPDDALLGPVNPPMPYPPGVNAATELPSSQAPPVR